MNDSPEVQTAAIARECSLALARVADGLRWAFAAGWYPGRRWIGEPKGAEMRLALADDDDRVRGPRDDIGMGDYKARQVVRGAGPKLTVLSRTVGRVVAADAVAHRARAVPRCVDLPNITDLADIGRAVRQLDAQLDRLTMPGAFAAFNDLALAWASGELTRARDLLTGLERSLARWADAVPESKALPTPMCVTCNLRPRPVRKGAVAGRECDTCATWRHRHKGKPRPTSLDADDRRTANEARLRRAAAGQGWGMA